MPAVNDPSLNLAGADPDQAKNLANEIGVAKVGVAVAAAHLLSLNGGQQSGRVAGLLNKRHRTVMACLEAADQHLLARCSC